MNFFKKNRAFTACLIMTLLGTSWLGWEILSKSGEISDIKENLDTEKEIVTGLKEKSFAVTPQNVEVSKQNLAAVKGRINDIRTALSAYEIKVAEMDKVEFKSYLRTSVDQMRKDLELKGISINTKYKDFSFKKLVDNPNPSGKEIKLGLTQLHILKNIIAKLPATVTSLTGSMGIEVIESIEWNNAGPVTSKTGAITYIPFELRLIGNQGAIRPFINSIVASKEIFMVIKSIEFNNPVVFGLKKKDAKAASTVKDSEFTAIEYKEDREIVSNNKVDWKLYIDIAQINDVKTN